MTQNQKLSLPQAILININVMLGAGIFLNTTLLAQHADALGFVSYLVIGALLLPLVMSMAQLVAIHPSGGFYVFGQKEINSFVGFMSGWSYFTAKLASAAIIIHSSVLTIQLLIPMLNTVHPFMIDFSIITLFVVGNMFNIKTGSKIQILFIIFKLIPIFFAILTGLFLFNGAHYENAHLLWSGIPRSLPLVIYATMGFEAACSLSSHIKDAHKNAPLAILISYVIAIGVIVLYQLFFYGSLGATLATQSSYRESFPRLMALLTPHNISYGQTIGGLFNLAIASSALGGSYGILFSNSWNLHALAQHNHLFFSSLFTSLNRHAIPFMCVIAEGILCVFYLIISQGPQQQPVLQQVSALGVVLAYTISVIALIRAYKKYNTLFIPVWIPFLGLINCALLLAACIKGLIFTGITALIYFAFFLLIGAGMFIYKKNSITSY